MPKGDGFLAMYLLAAAITEHCNSLIMEDLLYFGEHISLGDSGEYEMTETSKDAGLIAVLIKRFEEQRLPVALELKEKVDRGETLNDYDIAFLEQVFSDAGEIKPLLDRHSEYHELVGKTMSLYQEITEKALQNQQHD